MTVREEISIAYFGDPNNGTTERITLAPDDRFAAVHTTRGDLAENRMHDEVRVYDLARLGAWLAGPPGAGIPSPLITVNLGGSKEGPVITEIRWFGVSQGLAFLVKTETGHKQLWTASLANPAPLRLSLPEQDVDAFDIHDADHFVYTVRAPSSETRAMAQKPGVYAEEGFLQQLIAPDPTDPDLVNRLEVWEGRGGPPSRVTDAATGAPVIAYGPWAGRGLRLSPDGQKALITLPLDDVPDAWTRTYAQGPFGKVAPGPQDLSAAVGTFYVARNVVLDLATGSARPLGEGPTSTTFGWQDSGFATWSTDGRKALIEGAFFAHTSPKPCIAAFDVASGRGSCVTPLPENIYLDSVQGLEFEGDGDDRIGIRHCRPVDSICRTVSTHYRKEGDTWRPVGETPADSAALGRASEGVELEVRQDMNQRPVLWARIGSQAPRPVWDPNPQLDDVDLGRAELYKWTDKSGKAWVGGLYLPPDYQAGMHYPLVIQTHGFAPDQFRPSGAWPESYAARELAAAGIVVLQVPDCTNAYSGDPDEAACHEELYRAAVEQLSKAGMIDPTRVGITGFSRSCLYVMDLLVRKIFPVRAALTTDGVNDGYFQYVLVGDIADFRHDAEKWIGGPAWGAGLKAWMQRSPEFNLDKVDAPVLLMSAAGDRLLDMWEPYAILTAMHKPVELLMLRTRAHPTWQPAVRYASQQGAVDWFRFWLQGYEDPDSAKAAQYRRWEKLCEMQIEQNPNQQEFCVRSKVH